MFFYTTICLICNCLSVVFFLEEGGAGGDMFFLLSKKKWVLSCKITKNFGFFFEFEFAKFNFDAILNITLRKVAGFIKKLAAIKNAKKIKFFQI